MRRALARAVGSAAGIAAAAQSGAWLPHPPPAWRAAADSQPRATSTQPAPVQQQQQQQPLELATTVASPALPTDKLACHRSVPPPRTPVVLVSCGSFNPPTIAHLRLADLAVAALAHRGFDVWGCYMSPVGDAYSKPDLAPAAHRLAMARLAAEQSPCVMVDAWEAAQPGYTRTLQVLRHVADSLQAAIMQPGAAQQQQEQQQQQQQQPAPAGRGGSSPAQQQAAERLTGAVATTPSSSSSSLAQQQGPQGPPQPPQAPRVMLLCGADLLATINTPGVWHDPAAILREHGIVCVCRPGTDVEALLAAPGSVLQQHRGCVVVVEEPVPNAISSSSVRRALGGGQPVRYLVPDAVLAYIQRHSLYGSRS